MVFKQSREAGNCFPEFFLEDVIGESFCFLLGYVYVLVRKWTKGIH
jgi:hypothetical protein